jgi:hypothetical protein
VRELFWIDDNTLGAATYGRGMFKIGVASAGAPNNYADLWWAGTQENGWGYEHLAARRQDLRGDVHLRRAGTPGVGGASRRHVERGQYHLQRALYAPTGSWFGNYDASRVVVGPSIGTASLTFDSLNSATLTYTINGVSGTKSIQRQAFGPRDSTPVATYTDLWWGGLSQNGWGVAISQQYRTIFACLVHLRPGGPHDLVRGARGRVDRQPTSIAAPPIGPQLAWLGAAYNPAPSRATRGHRHVHLHRHRTTPS